MNIFKVLITAITPYPRIKFVSYSSTDEWRGYPVAPPQKIDIVFGNGLEVPLESLPKIISMKPSVRQAILQYEENYSLYCKFKSVERRIDYLEEELHRIWNALQQICPHPKGERFEDWSMSQHLGIQYESCKICGKRLRVIRYSGG